MIRIKICGITTEEDALICIEAGVDAIGFVFHKQSARYVSLEQVGHILKKVPVFINKVAVLTSLDIAFMDQLWKLGIDTFQVYFDVSLALRNQFCGVKFIRALRLIDEVDEALRIENNCVDAFLLDAYDHNLLGGTGKKVDWNLAAEFVDRSDLPVVLAGGLKVDNIVEAIRMVRPYGVDVSSGVEVKPGKKDAKKVFDFVRTVRINYI